MSDLPFDPMPANSSSIETQTPNTESPLSPKKLEANRLNALKSTGPRSPEGKARSALNGLTHGLRSRLDPQSLITDSERDQFSQFLTDLREALDPHNAVEDYLAERIALLAWQLRRAAQAQVHLLDATRRSEHRKALAHNKQAEETHELKLSYARPRDRKDVPPPDLRLLTGDSPASHVLYLLAQSGHSTLNTLQRYQSTTERAFYQALNQYRLLHEIPEPPPPDLHHHFHYHRHEPNLQNSRLDIPPVPVSSFQSPVSSPPSPPEKCAILPTEPTELCQLNPSSHDT